MFLVIEKLRLSAPPQALSNQEGKRSTLKAKGRGRLELGNPHSTSPVHVSSRQQKIGGSVGHRRHGMDPPAIVVSEAQEASERRPDRWSWRWTLSGARCDKGLSWCWCLRIRECCRR